MVRMEGALGESRLCSMVRTANPCLRNNNPRAVQKRRSRHLRECILHMLVHLHPLHLCSKTM